ncbi:MAG: PIG-L deacetylase family protein [Deltaproteobacteria bacterium]
MNIPKVRKILAAAALVLLLRPLALFAQDITPLPDFTRDDRVLVLAAHPDDETIGVAGVIMRALKAGARVKVGCFTSGDNNELSFILYEKRVTLRQSEFLHMGGVRRRETLAALASIGVPSTNVFFFGYPDFGTFSIMMRYWGKTTPYRQLLTRLNSVSYPEALSPGVPYVGESVLNDMRSVLKDFEPTKIFVNHPADTNSDHQTLYLFLKVALWELEDRMKPQVFPYLIHVVGWPVPRGLHPELSLDPPPENIFDVAWKRFDLAPDEVVRKKKMVGCYKSQLVYNPGYLYTFVRKNELFGESPEIKLKQDVSPVFLWNNVIQEGEKNESPNQVAHLAFSQKDGNLFIKLILKTALTKNLGVRVLLLPFNKKTDFARMPKFNITIGIGGMQIKNKKENVNIPGASVSVKNKIVVVKIPLKALGSPDRILSRTWARFSREFPFRAPSWRVIRLEP